MFKSGVPINCVIFTGVVSLISYLNVSQSTGVVFNWFVNLATTGYYVLISVCGSLISNLEKHMFQTGKQMKKGEYPYYLAPKFIHPYFTYFWFFH